MRARRRKYEGLRGFWASYTSYMCFGVAHRGPGFGGLESYAPSPSGPLKRYVDNPILKVTRCLNASLMKKLVIGITTVLIFINSPLTGPASADDNLIQPTAYFKSGVCGLTVEDAHISTYLLKMKKGRQVKINVFSKCGVPQQQVSFIVEIWKRGMLGDHKMRTFRQTIFNPINPRLIRYEAAKLSCKNYLPTIYYGKAQATVLINGKTFTSAWVMSEHLIPIDCGT